MNSDNPENKLLKTLTSLAISGVMRRGLPEESPHIDEAYRCPRDGSMATLAIQEILNEASISWNLDGRVIPAQMNSGLLNKYRPGPQPRLPLEYLLSSVLFLFIGFMIFFYLDGTAGLLCLMALAVSAFSLMLFCFSRKRLPVEVAKWRRRTRNAKDWWHCRQCSHAFLPRLPVPPSSLHPLTASHPRQETEESSRQESKVDPQTTPENVNPLVPKCSSTEIEDA